MSEIFSLSGASARFQAARAVNAFGPQHRFGRMHGHGFIASAFGKIPCEVLPFEGSDALTVQTHLARAVSTLDYSTLNDRIEIPSDENLAQWIADNIGLSGIALTGIQSTPDQGVRICADQTRQIWRRYHFRAAHQLPNVGPGHKCGRMHGHGFQVVLLAAQQAGTGYDELDAIWRNFDAQLNFRCLNDIDGLSNPTSELLSSWLWTRIRPDLPGLIGVTVFETASCGASFDGSRYRIWKDFSIDSAICMSQAPQNDPRRMIHGDTYLLRLHLQADLDDLMGWTVDFGDVKSAFNPLFKLLDHRPLYEQSVFALGDTASLAKWILTVARAELPALVQVDVIDSQGAGSLVSSQSDWTFLPA